MDDFRELLHAELLARKENNRSYSLRAFARDLQLSPSYLSELLQGKKHLSPARGTKIAEILERVTEPLVPLANADEHERE